MNPEVKKLWVEALRSGEYKQAKYFLNAAQGHCCLGVLCDLHAKATGGEWESGEKFDTPHRYQSKDSGLPIPVMHWAGLPFNFGASVSVNGVARALMHHNDNGRTFAEIADAIEEQL